jgi:erythromycin esterase
MLDEFRTYAAENSVPLDDAGALDDLFCDAQVVAIGESAHWVPEYNETRYHLTKFLGERHGFTVYGMESGFSEGLAVDAWVRGGPGDLDELTEHHFTYRMGQPSAMREQLPWMRQAGMRFLGLDVPGSAADPRPALRGEDTAVPELLGLVDRWAGEHQLPAHLAYREMERSDRDRLTALLTDLLTRLQIENADPVVRHELRLVVLLDQLMRGNYAARDLAMAETALTQADGKLVIGAANSHIQRVPIPLPGFTVPTLGTHLATQLNDQFVSVAVTAVAGTTPTRRPDPDSPGGVAVPDVPLPPARDDSVEAFIPGGRFLDLRPARDKMRGPGSLRVLDTFQEIDVLRSYDAVICLPLISERLHAER